jgi:hypothetical protein
MRLIKKAREPPPALTCFAHSCNLPGLYYTGQAIDLFRLHTPFLTMNPFDFKTVQHLDITTADSPSMDVKDGQLILMAERGDARIMITAPLNGLVPQVAKTTVRNGARRLPASSTVRKARPALQGSKNKLSKLTEEQVLEIRAIANDREQRRKYGTKVAMYRDLASKYGLHVLTVQNVINRVSWKHI